jgi:glycosyltransferase involved in cell wall biosynthesis
LKKICFVSLNNSSPWGGSEELWSQSAIILVKKGYSVSVIFYDWGKQTSSELLHLQKAGIQIVSIPIHQTFSIKLRRNLNKYLGDHLQQQLQSAYKKANPDFVIHTNMSPRGSDTLKWVINNNIPYILDIQLADDYLWHCFNNDMLECYTKAKAVFFLCNQNKNTTEKQLGVRLVNAKNHFNPIKANFDVKGLFDIYITKVHFACVGRMGIEHKRQDLVLEVLSQDKWLSRSWSLSFYGKGEHEISLRRLVNMFGLSDRVTFHGYVKDIQQIWNENHVLLLPSTYEGMSLSVLEAMKCGRIVVTTNVASSIEFIEDGINGFKSPAPTLLEYDLAMERAWNSKENWHEIARLAKNTIEDKVPNDAAAFFVDSFIDFV